MEQSTKTTESLDFQINAPTTSTSTSTSTKLHASTATATTSLSNAMAHSITTTFERFPKLPEELRLIIWRLVANTARDVQVKTYSLLQRSEDARSDKSFILATPFPPVLHACRESRIECTPLYSLHLRGYDGRDIVINPLAETLFLSFIKPDIEVLGAISFVTLSLFNVFNTLSDLYYIPRRRHFKHHIFFSDFSGTLPGQDPDTMDELPTAFPKLQVGLLMYNKVVTECRGLRRIPDSHPLEAVFVLKAFEENEIRVSPNVEYERINKSLRLIDCKHVEEHVEEFTKLVRWDKTWKVLQDCLKRAWLERA